MNLEIDYLWSHKCPKKWDQYTLIALVITIVVLLILAGVTISTLTGDNGLLKKTTNAKQENEDEKELELIKLALSAAQVAGSGTITTENLNNELKSNFKNDLEASETSVGWFYQSNKNYRIYKDGHIENADSIPKEYQQVEYIENDVSQLQYIDTEVIPNENTSVILDMMTFSRVNQAFFGCIEIDQRKTWRFFDNDRSLF